MAKSKSAQGNAAAKSSNREEKLLSSVKGGAVAKPSQTPNAKSKVIAKQAVKAQENNKKAKAVKEPSPEVDSDESEEEDEDEEDDASASSASSEIESDVEAPKANGTKTNDVANAEPEGEAETSDSSESSDVSGSDSDEEDDEDNDEAAAPTGVAPKAVASAAVDGHGEDDSDSDNDSEDDDDSEDDVAKPEGAVTAGALNGNLVKVASKDDDSEEDSNDSDDSEDDSEDESEDSDESDESEEEEKPAPKNNKRKAETESAATAAATVKKPKNAEIDGLDDAAKKNLFVGHLSYNIDEEWLTREFESFGAITRCVHMVDRETQRPRGFGYVEFANAEDGVKAQEAMNGKEIDGRAINVDFSRPKTDQPRQDRANQYGDRKESPPSSTLFVANLAFAATSDNVGEAFGQHAEVVGVRLPTDRETGEPKGFGYIEFSSVEEAQKAFAGMKGQPILGRVPRLDFSTPRPDRNSDGGNNGFSRGGGRGGFDRGGRGGGRGRGGFDRGGRGGRGGGRGGRGGSTNRGGFGDFQGKKMSFE